jgi:hypothetical protein
MLLVSIERSEGEDNSLSVIVRVQKMKFKLG